MMMFLIGSFLETFFRKGMAWLQILYEHFPPLQKWTPFEEVKKKEKREASSS